MNDTSFKCSDPVIRSARFRPWLWPIRYLGKRTAPVPPALYIVNAFCQRVLRLNADVPWNVHFTSRVFGDVRIGRNVWVSFSVSSGCYIQGGNGVIIGDDTMFAPGVKIVSANHDVSDYSKWVPSAPIRIGRRCWLGANAVVLPGVTLGDGVVVGAGAVVTRSFEDRAVVAGVPARVLYVHR